jgi:heme oxygenase
MHARLDAGLAVGDPHAGLTEYLAHLRLRWCWLAPIQRWLDAHADGPQDSRKLPPCPRIQWLREDLLEVAGAVPPEPRCDAWPAPASAAFRWGVCYVIEGSQLGGRVLLRRLAPRLGGHQPLMLSGGGATAQSQRWHEFLQQLGREVESPADIEECCAGARFAFARMLELAGLEPRRDDVGAAA